MFPRLLNAIFRFVNFFVLKIGPDSGIFSRRNIGGKSSLRHELPHTQNPGLVLATVHPVDSFLRLTSKLPRDWAGWGFGGSCCFLLLFYVIGFLDSFNVFSTLSK